MSESFEDLAAFGSDRIASRHAGEVTLRCARPKGWNPRRSGSQTRAAHPGTAVSWGGRLFEVVAADPSFDGGVSYRLAPWPETHAIRTLEPYDEAAEAARSAEHAERRRDHGSRGLSILLAPLAGLLPGEIQARMETQFGAPARAMTISSALVLLAVGVAGALLGLAASLGGPQSGLSRIPLPLCVYLVAESAVRLASAFLAERPMGTLFAELPYALLRPRGGADPAPPGHARRDRYILLEALLALLSPAEQLRLRADFGFEPILWGRRTAWLLLVVGASNAAVALLNAAAGAASLVDLLWLLAGSALAAEQAGRLRRLREGRPAGSVLGALVRPLARPLLGA